MRGGGFSAGNAYTPMADSCQCTAKATSILYINQPPIKINKLRKKSMNGVTN